MDRGETYIVKTHWGTFRMDARSYRDYLQGKSWISWVPGRKDADPAAKGMLPELPPEVTDAALRLRGGASAEDPYEFCLRQFPGACPVMPYKERMGTLAIDEMPLSFRSSNGLKRAGIRDFTRLQDILELEKGLKLVRNIGVKSEAEILRGFFNACYERLTDSEKALYWQEMLERADERNVSVS